MARNVFEVEIKDLLKTIFPVAERLDDSAYNREGGRQVRKKPYDYFGCTMHGRFFAAEAKMVHEPRFYFPALFSDHQHEALALAARHDAWAWVFINWRHAVKGEWGKPGVAIWCHYCLFKETIDAALEAGRKSVKPFDFDRKYWLDRVTGGWEPGLNHAYRNFLDDARGLPISHEADLELFKERLNYGNPQAYEIESRTAVF